MNIPDNYDQWLKHEREQARRIAVLPICYVCDQPIQDDHYYEIDSKNFCSKCLDDSYRIEVDFYE